jgi:hypothetical protein
MKVKSEQLPEKLKNHEADTIISAINDEAVKWLGFNACCGVIDVQEHSCELEEHGRRQIKNLCEVRAGVAQFLHSIGDDALLRFLASSRVKAMQTRISSFVRSGLETCEDEESGLHPDSRGGTCKRPGVRSP